MERQAQKKGWLGSVLSGKWKKPKTVKTTKDDDFAELEMAGNLTDLEKKFKELKKSKPDVAREFEQYEESKEAFKEKVEEPRVKGIMQRLLNKLKKTTAQKNVYKEIAFQEKNAREQAQKDALVARLESSMVRDVLVSGMDRGSSIRKFAKDNNLAVGDVETMAEKVTL